MELQSVDNDNHNRASEISSQDVFVECTYIVLQRFSLNIRAKCLYYHVVRERRGVLNCCVLVAIESQFCVLIMITALFKNTRTPKFNSCLHNCAFGCRQHNYDHKQRSYAERHKEDRNPPITNHKLLFP